VAKASLFAVVFSQLSIFTSTADEASLECILEVQCTIDPIDLEISYCPLILATPPKFHCIIAQNPFSHGMFMYWKYKIELNVYGLGFHCGSPGNQCEPKQPLLLWCVSTTNNMRFGSALQLSLATKYFC